LVILADPPYQTGLADQIVRGIVALAARAEITVAAVEHAAVELPLPAFADGAAGWQIDTRRYGHTAVTLLRPPQAKGPNREET
jgi:hypothetical protein